jgi:hypothetical protein
MKNDFINKFSKKLSFKTWFIKPKGFKQEEIYKLENIINKKLPLIFRDFLIVLGKDPLSDYLLSALNIEDFIKLKKDFIELLEDYGHPYKLPDNAFVFYSYPDEIEYTFFLIDEKHEDPPIYLWTEDNKIPKKINSSFSEFLIEFLENKLILNLSIAKDK